MDSDRLNRWLTLGANVGVLVGIILLVFELSQNQEMMRAQTRNEISRAEMDLLALTAGDRDLSEIIVRANAGEELSDAENLMFTTRSESIFRLWQNVHYQYRHGMYDESEFVKHRDTMSDVLGGNESLVSYWCRVRDLYSSAFAADLDDLLPLNLYCFMKVIFQAPRKSFIAKPVARSLG